MTCSEIAKRSAIAFLFGIFGSILIHTYIFFKENRSVFDEYSADKEVSPLIKFEPENPDKPKGNEIEFKLPPKHESFSPLVSNDDVLKDLVRLGISKNIPIIFRDEKYVYVEYKWLDSYSSWWVNFLKENHINFIEDAFDCDNFSDLFMVLYNLSAINSDKRPKGQLVCGTLAVENEQEFAGIPAQKGSWHSLNIVWTNFGWFVFEPQNGVYISLRNYPNKNNIKAIIF